MQFTHTKKRRKRKHEKNNSTELFSFPAPPNLPHEIVTQYQADEPSGLSETFVNFVSFGSILTAWMGSLFLGSSAFLTLVLPFPIRVHPWFSTLFRPFPSFEICFGFRISDF
jgi:hypothetical protein